MDEDERAEKLTELRNKWTAGDLDRQDIGRRMNELRARHLLAVNDEIRPDGKSRYSSRETRAAAVTVRVAEDEEFQGLLSDHRRLEVELSDLRWQMRDLMASPEW